MATNQDLPQDLERELEQLLSKLDDESLETRDAATRELRSLLDRVRRSNETQYAAVIAFLKRRRLRLPDEAKLRVADVLGAALIEIKFVRQEFLGNDRGDLFFEYSITIDETQRAKVFDIHIYIGDDTDNAYYRAASIQPIDEPGFKEWPDQDSWSNTKEDGQLILKGSKPLDSGEYHFKITVSNIRRTKGEHQRKVDAVATERHGAPLLDSKSKVESPFLVAP